MVLFLDRQWNGKCFFKCILWEGTTLRRSFFVDGLFFITVFNEGLIDAADGLPRFRFETVFRFFLTAVYPSDVVAPAERFVVAEAVVGSSITFSFSSGSNSSHKLRCLFIPSAFMRGFDIGGFMIYFT